MFRGVIISFAICQVPSLLKVIVRERRPSPSVSEIVGIVLNVVAFIVQIGILPFLTTGLLMEGNHTILEGINSTTYQHTPITITTHIEWELMVGLLLFSLGYWENYVSGDWTICGKFRIPFKHWRKILQDSRDTVNILVIPWKIGFMVLLARLLTKNTDFQLASVSNDFDNTTVSTRSAMSSVEDHFHSYSLMYLQLGSGIVITYLSGLACKLHMQRVAFSLSITLAPPVTLVVIYLQCHFEFLPAHWHMGGWFCSEENIKDLLIPLACALALWVSYAITVSHIWFPQSERMAKLEK